MKTALRITLRVTAVVVLVLGLTLAFAAGAVSAYEAAKVTARIGLLFAALLIVFFGISLLVIGLAAKLWQPTSRSFTVIASAGLTLLLVVTLSVTVLRPMQTATLVPVPRANTRYWSLPTGSRIAYSLYEPPPGVPVKPDPVVFLHGGPGLRANDYDHTFYSQFAQYGFKVYLFDQAGSGLSDRLPEAKGYTVERFVDDLEAIRQSIGVERMILIGHSWGGMLAAHYAAAHPNRVAKLVFHSPGPIWIPAVAPPFEFERTDAPNPYAAFPPLRVAAAFALANVNVTAAENLVPQAEMGTWQLHTLDPRELVCKGEADRLPLDFSPATMAGTNLYPIPVTNRELKQKRMDVRPQLAQLHVPAIAVYGQCDMIPWSDHSQYRQSIPGLQEFYFEDAGHYIDLSQPAKFAALIRSFLLDQAPPFAPYKGDRDPRPPVPTAGSLR